MSQTVCTYPIVAFIAKAEDILGKNRVWRSVNTQQEQFLKLIFDVIRDEIQSIPEIESIVSWSSEDINQFLQKRGFSITLEPFDADTFGAAATLILLLEWQAEGMKEMLQAVDEKTYDAVRLNMGIAYYSSASHPAPVVEIDTKSGDKVYLTVMETPPDDILTYVEGLNRSLKSNWDYDDLVFPMVSLDQLVDISWLINMETTTKTGQPAWISQAKQQTIFKMNEKGALLKSAAAGAVTLESIHIPKPDLVIDRPFLAWIIRDGLSKPLLVAHITMDDWKNPGELSV